MIQFVKDCWTGKAPLWTAFWVPGMFFGTLLGIIMTVVSILAFPTLLGYAFAPEHSQASRLLAGYLVVLTLGFWWTYYIWHLVGVWRCAKNSACPLTRWGARLFVLVVTFTYWPVWARVMLEQSGFSWGFAGGIAG